MQSDKTFSFSFHLNKHCTVTGAQIQDITFRPTLITDFTEIDM